MAPGAHDGDWVTVVVPVYNRGAEAVEAARSILAQSHERVRLVLVDDGSTDDTHSTLTTLVDPRTTVLRCPHRGVSAARNAGARTATSEWITFLDSDDRVGPTWLEELLGATGERVGVVCCGAQFTRDRGETDIVLPTDLGPAFESTRGLFLAGCFVVRRSLFVECCGYNESLSYSENTELALRLVAACKGAGLHIISVDRPLVCVRDEGRPDRAQQYRLGRYEAAVLILEQHHDLLARSPSDLEAYLSIAGVEAMRLHRYAEGARWLRHAWRTRPTSVRSAARFGLAHLPIIRDLVWTT